MYIQWALSSTLASLSQTFGFSVEEVAQKQDNLDGHEETLVCGEKRKALKQVMSQETVSCNVKGCFKGILSPHIFFLKLFFFLWIIPVICILEVHAYIYTY